MPKKRRISKPSTSTPASLVPTLLKYPVSSRNKADIEAWAVLEEVDNVDMISQTHLNSIYRQDPQKHWLCPHTSTTTSQLENYTTQVHSDMAEHGIVISDEESSFPDAGLPRHGCIKLKCRSNPNCLNYLGVSWWDKPESKQKFVEERMKERNIPWSRSLLDRPRNIATRGLMNFGSTCYCNSLLQVWFHNHKIRSQVYKHTAPGYTLLNHLANLFTHLEKGIEPVHRPEEFMAFLQLNRNVQQDVHEFSKLMLQNIDESCKKFDSTALIGGKLCYVTQCNECGWKTSSPGTFHEITLIPKPNAHICDMLADAWLPEVMDGANQIFCQECNTKRDATRRTILCQVGSTLCLHIMRFEYDQKTQSKRKNTSAITIDHEIVLSDKGAFKLSAIINHKGRSTEHGHYFTHVYDQALQKWLQLDDSKVTVAAKENILKSSSEAYLLYYTRSDAIEDPSSLEEPPARYQTIVDAKNSEYEQKLHFTLENVKELEREFDKRRAMLRDMHTQLRLCKIDEPCIYLPTTFLEEVFSPQPPNPPVLDCENISCLHEMLDPHTIGTVKRVAVDGGRKLLELCRVKGPVLDSTNSQCMSCIKDHIQSCQSRMQQKSTYVVFEELLKSCPNTTLQAEDESSPPQQGKEYWVSRNWLKEVRRAKCMSDPIHGRNDLYCPHGGLAPDTSKLRRISHEAFEVLRGQYPSFCCPPTTMPACQRCLVDWKEAEKVNTESWQKAHDEQALFGCLWPVDEYSSDEHGTVKVIKDVAKLASDSGYLVAHPFLIEWYNWVRDPTQNRPPYQIDNRDLLCAEHGRLSCNPAHPLDRSILLVDVVPDDLWAKLISKYPCAMPVRSDVQICEDCRKRKLSKSTVEINVLVVFSQSIRRRRRPIDAIACITETVLDLKMGIMEDAQALPINQKLRLHGEECKNDATMIDIGAFNSCVFEIEILQQLDIDEEQAFGGKEVGFSGVLAGAHADSQINLVGSSSEDEADDEITMMSVSKSIHSRQLTQPLKSQ